MTGLGNLFLAVVLCLQPLLGGVAPGQPRPHAVTSTSAGGSFDYDDTGLMTGRRDASGLATYSYLWWGNHKLRRITSNASNDVVLFYYGPDACPEPCPEQSRRGSRRNERVRQLHQTPSASGRNYNTWTVFPWYQLERGCFRPDIDCDGDVDILDVQSVAAQFNAVDPDPKYDQTGDGAVTVADIILVAEKWLWSRSTPEAKGRSGEGAGSALQVIKLYTLGDRLVAVRRGNELTYVFQDHPSAAPSALLRAWLRTSLGSPALETDTTGNALTRFRYEPYGSAKPPGGRSPEWTIRGTEWTLPIDRGFTGQTIERGLGLHDYGARHYAQPLGRWIALDTIVPDPGNPQSLNRYSYGLHVYNNPLKYNDPSGHCPWCFVGALAGATLAYGVQVYGNMQSGMDLGAALTADIDVTKVVGGAIAGFAVVAMAPVAIAAASDALVGAGLVTGSAEVFAAGMTTAGVAAKLGNAVYGAPVAGGLEGVIERGFQGDKGLFDKFKATLQKGLPQGTQVALRGSVVSNRSWKTGLPFDSQGPGTSDIDVALIGKDVMKLWRPDSFYIPGVNTMPLSDETAHVAPALNGLRMELQAMVGRPVNFQATTDWFLRLRTLRGEAYLNIPE